jgi:integrase
VDQPSPLSVAVWAFPWARSLKGSTTMARRRDVKHRGVFEHPRSSGIFWIRYFVHGREFRQKVGTKSEAIALYQQRKTEAREGRLATPKRQVPFDAFVREYLESERRRARSFVTMARHGRRWIERFGGRPLRSILPLDVEKWATRQATELGPASVNRELSFLRRVFNVAMANGLVEQNPVKGVKFLREPSGRVRFLTEDEETRLRAEVGEPDWPLVAFAINTGLRQGEQFGLRWSNVDIANRVLTIPRSKHGGARHVQLNETAMAILRDLPSRLHSAWVFPSQAGGSPLNVSNVLHRIFLPAVRRAGIEDFRWHDLRHTFASRLAMAGADLRTIQELMGHKLLTMTLRYAHLSPTHLHAAVRLLDRSSGGRTGTKPAPDRARREATNRQVLGTSRAGDRDRTDDLVLGKHTL